ncbi:putative ribonuclease H-like domain-containing protein [Tanacetum coccineum]|uniref:Ribonuclease H-like domain-containing protein n=1 Tax=Tanacetum coccineum TaxID=301880 RepID=A0ABQ5JCF5_9ASTR
MESCSIVSQLTPLYTPQHNGVSKRRNHTLLDMVRSMMNLTTLPKSFWRYALESVAYSPNMVPTKKVERKPYEIWHGKTPKLSYLRDWGCEALETICYYFSYPLENKTFVAQNVEFFKNNLIIQETSGSHGLLKSSGSDEGLELIQEEDTQPSENTSKEHNVVAPTEVEPQNVRVHIRRSVRIPQALDRYGFYVDVEEHELGDLNEPPNYKVALSYPKFEKWLEAMDTEMQSINDNQVWILVDLPPNGRTVGSKWIFKKKTDIDGKQASRSWNKRFDVEIKKIGFTQNPDEPRVYLKASGSSIAFLVLYVDNILLMENDVTMLQVVKSWLCSIMYVTAVKAIIKYLRNTKDMVLVYGAKPEAELKSAKQSTTIMSSIEAEYIAAAEASMEAIWMRKFIDGLGGVMPSNKRPIEMLCDNEPAIAIADDPRILKGARHFQRKYHYIRESMRMEQYLTHTDYALWEVIVNGDAPAIASASAGTEGPIPPKTVEQKLARKNELKAKSTLLLDIPDEHLLKFHGIKDANTLWEAIKASQLEIHGEVISQEDANLKLLRSLPSAWNNIALIMRNKSDLDTLSMDDLYNNLKVYESKIKVQSSSSSNSQNVAFLSLENTSSTNEAVNTTHEVSTASSQGYPQLDNKDLDQIDTDDLEEMDLKWASRNQGNRNGDAPRRVVPVETPTNALVVQDGIGGYDRSFQAKEGITNFALMDYTSQGSSSSDSEVHTCSKDCLKSYETLQKQYDQQRKALKKSNLEIIGYQIGLKSLEARILVHEKNEAVYEEDIAFLKYDVQVKDISIKDLKNQLEEALKEIDDLKLKLEKFEESLKNLTKLINSQISAKDKAGLGKGFHAFPPPYTGNYMPSRPDLSFDGKPKTVRPSAPIIEDWDTDSDNDSVFRPKSDQTKPRFTKINFVKSDENVKSVNKENTYRQIEYHRKSQSPRDNRRNWNGMMTRKLGNGQVPVNTAKQSSPRAAASISIARPVNTAAPKSKVNDALPKTYSYFKAHSLVRRAFNQKSAAKTNKFNEKVNTTRRPTGNVIDHTSKDSGSYMLKRFDYVDLQGRLKSDQGIFDSGCSRHMTGNKSFLTDYQEIDGGFVAFGGSPKGGKITGKGKIRTGKLDFEDVYFVKELKFNLFSVSQMCDKKNSVLFTKTECLVLSPDFKLLDESQVLLKVPRQNNMYSFDLKNVVPSGGLTCLFAKATIDESNLWHRRLGHINFKTMNKLVRGNLVRGLPSKLFENDHTCVACQKGKQHKASCKTKLVSSISQPLQMLHMDLFGPTSVRSINHKTYCLVVTDDYSRFSWVFFLATKDETSGILKTFITGIENQINHKVKIIRCDNGTEFKNNDMNQFCGMKVIKGEFSVARTPQQNGVAERKNRTLIEEVRTMLADSLLPTTFWAEAVSTACYV